MAMHCPRCLTEYRDGFSECADCRVPLADGPPPAAQPPEHEVNLVTVLETSDPFLMNLAKATLEDAGIEYVVAGDDAGERLLTGMPVGAQPLQFQVEAASAAKAREALAPLENPEPDAGTEEEAAAEPEAES
jgi:hypothetical protein